MLMLKSTGKTAELKQPKGSWRHKIKKVKSRAVREPNQQAKEAFKPTKFNRDIMRRCVNLVLSDGDVEGYLVGKFKMQSFIETYAAEARRLVSKYGPLALDRFYVGKERKRFNTKTLAETIHLLRQDRTGKLARKMLALNYKEQITVERYVKEASNRISDDDGEIYENIINAADAKLAAMCDRVGKTIEKIEQRKLAR